MESISLPKCLLSFLSLGSTSIGAVPAPCSCVFWASHFSEPVFLICARQWCLPGGSLGWNDSNVLLSLFYFEILTYTAYLFHLSLLHIYMFLFLTLSFISEFPTSAPGYLPEGGLSAGSFFHAGFLVPPCASSAPCFEFECAQQT